MAKPMLNLDELRRRYYEQLPMMVVMMLPEGEADPNEIAEEAINLIETILDKVAEV